MKPKRPKPRRVPVVSLGDKATDEAVQAMFRLSPEESRRIIAETSPKPRPKRK